MRILFLNHFPLDRSLAGRAIQYWRAALAANGHETRTLVVSDRPEEAPAEGSRTIVCGAHAGADLPFPIPYFRACAADRQQTSFPGLTDKQLEAYCHRIRQVLDQEVDQFDPHVIHGQHVWVQGQLALETGVPYVLNGWGPELRDYAQDPRYRPLADQAAENASRVLVADKAVGDEMVHTFPSAAVITPMDPALYPPRDSNGARHLIDVNQALEALYRSVYAERFGRSM